MKRFFSEEKRWIKIQLVQTKVVYNIVNLVNGVLF